MPGKILQAREFDRDVRFSFHLDESKRRDDDTPDPAFVREYIWTKPLQQPGEKPADYRKRLDDFVAMATREAKLLAQHEAAKLAPAGPPDTGKALIDEGKAF